MSLCPVDKWDFMRVRLLYTSQLKGFGKNLKILPQSYMGRIATHTSPSVPSNHCQEPTPLAELLSTLRSRSVTTVPSPSEFEHCASIVLLYKVAKGSLKSF